MFIAPVAIFAQGAVYCAGAFCNCKLFVFESHLSVSSVVFWRRRRSRGGVNSQKKSYALPFGLAFPPFRPGLY